MEMQRLEPEPLPARRLPTASCACCLPRRALLAGLGGVAALAAGPRSGALAAPAVHPSVIDVHAHFVSPGYLRDMAGEVQPQMKAWSLSRHLEAMDQAGVARTLLSVTAPAIPAAGERGRSIAREINEFGARLVADHAPRLGLFAAVPATDPAASLAEAAYALDELRACGVGLMTSYGGKWLGDPLFDSLFDELNRRGAVVFVHPTSPACCAGALPYLSDAYLEYGFDTTRAIANYVYRGAARRFPKVRLIFSHAGGAMPFLIGRFDQIDRLTPSLHLDAPQGFRAEAARFFYDTANSPNPVAMTALRQVVGPSQVLFGSDFPYNPPADHIAQLDRAGVFSRAELAGVYGANLARSLPALLA